MSAASPLPCPRCRSTTTGTRSRSQVPGIWTVYGCDTCSYTWRSTEPVENIEPDKYPAVFRLDPATIAGLPEVPGIPPLRTNVAKDE